MLLSGFASALTLSTIVNAIPTFSLDVRQATTLNAAMLARNRSYIGTSLTIRSDNTEQNLIKGAEFGSRKYDEMGCDRAVTRKLQLERRGRHCQFRNAEQEADEMPHTGLVQSIAKLGQQHQ